MSPNFSQPFFFQSIAFALLSLPAVAHSPPPSVSDGLATSGSHQVPAFVDHTSKPPHRQKMKGKKKATGNGDLVPPPEVLGLVGSFFSQYGLESTKKAFAKELKRLQQTADWPAPPAAETAVDLQSTFMKWVEEQKTQPAESTSESEDATSVSESTSTSSDSSEVSSEDDSSSDESSTSEDQIKSKSAQKPQKSKVQKRAASPSSSSSASPSSSSSASASDSDADDEDENKTATPVKSTAGKKKSKTAPETTEAVVKKNLKRKAESSSSESSSSDSESDSSDDDRAAKRTKVDTKDAADDASTSETSTSTSEESDEDKDIGNAGELANGTKPVSVQEASSESSGTVRGDNMDVDTQQPTFEDAAERTPRSTAPLKKKHTGARPTPLAQLSAHATADSHISNAYQSYEYAERAYNDLSVTRGKGFTKEKNKKKRGSYRGGPIDISGGKGFKFDD
ncbi:jun-like transcription factor [Exophiala xenobiotica]|nr:jun-like transcription factor [Exophiala xenobiotica]